jgi:Trypsin-co-occurring domain 2
VEYRSPVYAARRAWEVGDVMHEYDGIGPSDRAGTAAGRVGCGPGKGSGYGCAVLIETLTVELRVGVTRSAEGRAGFKVPFVGADFGGSAGYDRETTQTMTVVLGSPVDREGRPVKVAKATDEVRG